MRSCIGTGRTPAPQCAGRRDNHQSFINANVHTDPPVGIIAPAERLGLLPPRPDSTEMYCWPLRVYVITGALMLEPVLNCHNCLPSA